LKEEGVKSPILLLSILFFAVCVANAHQPRISFGAPHPFENPVFIDSPEISKAYYGELKGAADYYKIESDRVFNLYVNILVPDEKNARTDMSVDITAGDTTIFDLKGDEFTWERFFEEFARDSYLKGPEINEDAAQGTYYLKVYDKDNTGKYALAVGNIESFPLLETIKMAWTLPRIKRDFFNKPALSAFFNIIGLFFAVYLLIALAIITGIFFIVRRLRRRRRKKR
jgi:hypothetical protein